MRAFSADFAAEIARTHAEPFWTVVLHLASGDIFLSGRHATIGADEHTPILGVISQIGAGIGRREPMKLDVGNADAPFVNVPAPVGLAGQLAAGQRLTDLFARTLETSLVEIYLTMELPDATFVQEIVFKGVVGRPTGGGLTTGNLHIDARTERYLNASALRKTQSTLYPFARPSDIHATVPIVIGLVPKAPGRIVKGSRASVPVSDPGNVSTAVLLPPEITDVAGAETWTVEFSDPETVEFVTTPNSNTALNLSAESGSTEPIAAQSFQTTDDQIARWVSVPLKATGTVGNGVGWGAWPYVSTRVEIWSDSGGTPSALLSPAAKIVWAMFPLTTYVWTRFVFPSGVAVTGGVSYWLVLFSSPGGHMPNVYQPVTSTVLHWGRNNAGGYAGGTAKKGTRTRQSYATQYDFGIAVPSSLSWDSALDGQDFGFQFSFSSDTYSLTGSITGNDGDGTLGTDFVSTSGAVRIASDRFQGHPEAGDKFTFLSDPTDSVAIFSESPAATPVAAIDAVYLGDTKIATGTTHSHSTTPDETIAIGHSTGTPLDEWLGLFARINVAGTQTFKQIGFQVRAIGVPTDPLIYSVYEDIADNGGVNVPNRRKPPLASATVIPSVVPTGATPPFTYAAITPLTITDAYVWVGIETANFDGTNFYAVSDDIAAGYTSVRVNHNGAFYVGDTYGAFLPGYSLVGATIGTDLSIDDGSGNLVARATMDFDIPDGSAVTADIQGIKDDSTGTYTTVPGIVLRVPDEIFHWILNRAGLVDDDIDLAGSFAASRVQYADLYRFDGVIQDDSTYKTLLLKLAYECRSVFDWVVNAALRFIPDTFPSPAAALTFNDLIEDANRRPLVRMERSALEEMINSLTANYNRVAASSDYKSTIARFAPDSVQAFGLLERMDLRGLDFVRSEAMAKAVIDARLKRQALPFWRVFLTTWLGQLAIEKDDSASLDLTNPIMGDCLGGWDGSQSLQVDRAAPQPDHFTIELDLRETGVPVNIIDGDGYRAPVSIVVLLDQGDLTTEWDWNMAAIPFPSWTSPPTSGGLVFNGILLNDGWVLYVENGLHVWDQTPRDNVLPWLGFPPARIVANEHGDMILDVG